MRVLPAPRRATSDLPDAKLLAEARSLASRFPQARLRPVSLARLPEADARAGGARVWAALESLQVTGSFKVRGALLALSRLEHPSRGVVCASAGNHGAGVAYAASILDIEATVVVPRTAPETKRARIAQLGAKLVVIDADGYDAAERAARAFAEREKLPFVSPYDDLAIIAGNGASLGYEIESALGRAPAVLIAPMGGGGLVTGLGCALPGTRVFGAQSEASAAFALSLERGSAVEALAAVGTLADGLEGGIAATAFERALATVAGVVVVTEAQIGAAMAGAHRSLGVTIEGSAAAAVAPLLTDLPPELCPGPDGDLVVVLTGRNVDRAQHGAVLEENKRALW